MIQMKVMNKQDPLRMKINLPSIHSGSGTNDYEKLLNKPSINGVTLIGNKTTEDLHLEYDDTEIKQDIEDLGIELDNLDVNKQNKLIAGDNITIENNIISASGGGVCLENTLFANYGNFDTRIDFASILPEINEIINKNLGKVTILNIFGSNKKVFYRFYFYEDVPTSTGGSYTDTITGYYIINGGLSQTNLQQRKFSIKYDTRENGTINISQFNNNEQGNELTFKSEVLLKNNTTTYTPTSNYNPATKKYVDDTIASAITTTLGGEY